MSFSTEHFHWGIKGIIPNQFCNIVLAGEAIGDLVFMLPDTPVDIIGHPRVNSAFGIGHDVGVILPIHV
jgi:hypothetical protein